MRFKSMLLSLAVTCFSIVIIAGCSKSPSEKQVVENVNETVAKVASDNTSATTVTVVKQPDMSKLNDYYVSNKAPLKPSVFIKLPVGDVKPGGWVASFLEKQRDGLTGKLGTVSAWLQKKDNAWLADDGKGAWGWEEVPYWLKGYGNLGYVLGDEQIIAEAKTWIEAAFDSQRENGDFGPDQRHGNGTRDYWSNMIMLFCLQSYYEYTEDPRVLDLMTKYFKYQSTISDEAMLSGYWDRMRGGDNIYSIYWLYNRTGEEWLLDVADLIHRNTANWTMENDLPNWHNVNIAQAFGEPATFYLQSHKDSDLKATYNNFYKIREIYGQVPGGMFGGDENCRVGYDDPRQGVETCGLVEQMLSDELLFQITGDVFWADHCEEVAFNTYPAAVMPDFRSLRYITSPNMVLSDSENHSPGIDNSGPFLMMNPFSSRCCQHNHSHGWPYYAEHLWMATPDNGVCAVMYSESTVDVQVGNGTKVSIKEVSNYPFDEDIKFSVSTSENVSFPFYLRVPKWCDGASVSVNGETFDTELNSGEFVKIEREWQDGDTVSFNLPMDISLRIWEKNHNSVSVDYGPLTFSLKIDENNIRFDSEETAIGDSKWQKGVDKSLWPSYEIHPASAWNYGLVLDPKNPEKSFKLTKKDWPADNFPFTLDSVPFEMTVKAKKIPNWQLDRYGLCAILQDSPVKSDEPVETVKLVPMGAARLRISSFPTIGDGSDANQWQKEAIPPVKASHSGNSDSPEAVIDNVIPERSSDDSMKRFTWWSHKGSREWIELDLQEVKEISSVSIYWFDDTGKGECRVPQSWKLLYKAENGGWQGVEDANGYGVEVDKYNKVDFSSLKTSAIRIEVQLQKNYSGGIFEIKVD